MDKERLREERWEGYRQGIERAATEVEIVCDRLDKSELGQNLGRWLRTLPDDPTLPHPETPMSERLR